MKENRPERQPSTSSPGAHANRWIGSQTIRLGFALGCACLVQSKTAVAEGFRNPPPGTFNLGRAGGRIAQIDDSSAIQQNPANLVEVPAELQLTPSFVYIGADYQSPTGQNSKTEDPWKLLPNLFASMPILDGTAALGLGITVPYGLSNNWDEDSTAFARPTGVWRYQAPHYTELQTLNINPTVSFKIGEHLRVGAGFDAMWSELTLKQFYPWFLFPGGTLATPDGHLKAKGDGIGYGGNVGVTWLITERQRVALTYRSPLNVHYDSDFEMDNIPAAAAGLGATPRSDFSTKVRFPTIVAAGYGIQLTDTIRLEADVEWVEFSRFQSLDLNMGRNAFLLPSTNIRQDWKDTFTVGIGGDWRFAPNWVLRAGYQFYQSPVPDHTFSPTIPDANQNVLTVGLGYKYKSHSVEGAYGADFYDARKIQNNQNPAFNGNYDITVHLFSLAYHYTF